MYKCKIFDEDWGRFTLIDRWFARHRSISIDYPARETKYGSVFQAKKNVKLVTSIVEQKY